MRTFVNTMRFITGILIASGLAIACSKLAGDINLDPTFYIKQQTLPCVNSLWQDCAKIVGKDYNIGYSPKLEAYSLMYVRGAVVFELLLDHEGKVKQVIFGPQDFVNLTERDGVTAPVIDNSAFSQQEKELLLWEFERESRR